MSEQEYKIEYIDYSTPIYRYFNLLDLKTKLEFEFNSICFFKIQCKTPIKELKKLSKEELLNSDIGISSIALSCIELDEMGVHYLEIPAEKAYQCIKILRESDIIVSHNMVHTQMLLDNLCHGTAELPLFEFSESQLPYCTLEHGTPLNDQHIYLGGRKQKKYITLDKLHDTLCGELPYLEEPESYLQAVENCFIQLVTLESSESKEDAQQPFSSKAKLAPCV